METEVNRTDCCYPTAVPNSKTPVLPYFHQTWELERTHLTSAVKAWKSYWTDARWCILHECTNQLIAVVFLLD